MRRPWIVPLLIACALVGAVLIVTAEDDTGVALDSITTEEGLRTRVPEGWVASAQFAFDFVPDTEGSVFEQWTVARACPLEGCGERALDDWLALAPDLPSFTSIVDSEGDGTFNVEVESLSDARVVRAQTESAGRLVFVAAFTDGAAEYVACSVRLGPGADQRLADAIVDVCRSTVSVT